MTTLAEKLLQNGILPMNYAVGEHKTTCPRCSHLRTKRRDPCLSLAIEAEAAVWNCHHCGWKGGISMKEPEPIYKPRRKAAPVRPKGNIAPPSEAVMVWFAQRGIPADIVRKNRIGSAHVYIPALEREVDCIAFPYYRGNELVNVKFRALGSKDFSQVKDAEKILFGLDNIGDGKEVVIVEGECDLLALQVAGIHNVVSVPDGAPTKLKEGDPSVNDLKFEYLANCAAALDGLKRIIIAGDEDGPGRILAEELARRLGKARCWRAHWPHQHNVQLKDANETLISCGAQVVAECIASAEPYPISGLHKASDFIDETLALYRDGRKRGLLTGWPSVDELMTIREGLVTVVTGVPSSGKSEFLDALMINLAERYGWRFGVCSLENPPVAHNAKLAEKYAGLPFWDGPRQRMTEAELRSALAWVDDHFFFIRTDGDAAPTIDWILERAKVAVMRHGIRGLIVDPYNEVESQRPAGMTETEYVSHLLGRLRRFAVAYNLHVWIVAHPAKMQREGNSIPVPTLYDISGSANWANKPDFGIVIHRDPTVEPSTSDIYVRKVRFKELGKIGKTTLRYDPATGRYSEPPPPARTGAARAYADD